MRDIKVVTLYHQYAIVSSFSSHFKLVLLQIFEFIDLEVGFK